MALPEINFKEQAPRIIAIVAVLAAVAVILTIVISLISNSNQNDETGSNDANSYEEVSTDTTEPIETTNDPDEIVNVTGSGFLKDDPLFAIDQINSEDIFLPPVERLFKFGRYEFFRGIQRQWTWEDIKQFWHDPREISAELLENSNDLLIDSLLESVD